jgi:ceramide glucosyltransferase
MSFVTYAIPMSILAAIGIEASLDWDAMSLVAIWIALTLRVTVHLAVGWTLKSYRPTDLFLIPIRDLLSFAVWATSYVSRNVAWKNQKFYVHADGRMDTRGSAI